MDKDVKDLLAQLADDKNEFSNLWELQSSLSSEHPDDRAPFLKIFNEEQLALVKVIVDYVVAALKFHDEFEESHMRIVNDLKDTNAKLRNHRHDTTKQFSAKPEF